MPQLVAVDAGGGGLDAGGGSILRAELAAAHGASHISAYSTPPPPSFTRST